MRILRPESDRVLIAENRAGQFSMRGSFRQRGLSLSHHIRRANLASRTPAPALARDRLYPHITLRAQIDRPITTSPRSRDANASQNQPERLWISSTS